MGDWFKTLPYYSSFKKHDGNMGTLNFETPDGVLTIVYFKGLPKLKKIEVSYQTYVYPTPYNPTKTAMAKAGGMDHVRIDPTSESITKAAKKAAKDVSDAYEKRMRQKAGAKKTATVEKSATGAANAGFIVGAIYDSKDFFGKVQVVSRTPKTLTLRFLDTNNSKKERKCNVMVDNGEEYIYPMGSGYANAPIMRARRDKVNGAASVGRMKEAASSLKKDAEVRNYLNGWNGIKPRFKAKLDSEGRVILSRAVNSDAMPAAKILELVASSRKNPVIHDVQSTAHGCFVDRKDAIAFFERQRKEDIVKSDVNRRDAFTVESIRKAVRKVHTGRTVVTHPKLVGSSEDSNRYEIEMEASNGAFANVSLFWSPIGRWIYDANVGVKHTTGLIHKYPNKVLYSYLDLDAYLRETKKELEEAKKQRATLDAAQKKPSRGI